MKYGVLHQIMVGKKLEWYIKENNGFRKATKKEIRAAEKAGTL